GRPGGGGGRGSGPARGGGGAGSGEGLPPEPIDAAIVFAAVGELVPAALAAVARGGSVVCAGIHMSDIPSFPYSLLWEERLVRSGANLTPGDGEAVLAVPRAGPLRTQAQGVPPLAPAGR